MEQCFRELLKLELMEDLWGWIKNFLGLLEGFSGSFFMGEKVFFQMGESPLFNLMLNQCL